MGVIGVVNDRNAPIQTISCNVACVSKKVKIYNKSVKIYEMSG
jgi:hypothetical protein